MKKETIGKVNVYHGDCMDFMRGVPDNHYDLAIVDPPYGIGVSGQKENRKGRKSDRKLHVDKGWDDCIPERRYFDQLDRVSLNCIIWGGNYFIEHLFKGRKGWVVWDKGQHGLTMSDCELAYSTFNKPTRVWIQNRSILASEGTIHPTQKPVKLYEWLLTNYAKEGDKILDTHFGSGSHGVACNNMGFELDAVELDEDYYKASVQRLKDEYAQTRLF